MSQEEQSPRRSRWWRRIAIGAAALLVVLCVLVALAPWILSGAIGRAIVRSAIGSAMDGTVEVESVEFSWSGPQSMRGVRVTGADGSSATVNASVDAPLLDLALGRFDALRAKGDLAVNTTYDEDGRLAITGVAKRRESVAPSAAAGAGGGSSIPNLILDIERSSIVAAPKDATAGLPTLGLRDLTARLEHDSGTISGEISATTVIGDRGGSLKATLSAKGLLDSGGALRTKGASLDCTIEATSLPVLAAVAPVEVERLDLTLRAADLDDALDASVDMLIAREDATAPQPRVVAQATITHPAVLAGLPAAGALAMSGSAQGRDIPTSLLGPYLGGTPIDIPRDIGPRLDADVALEGPKATVTARVAAGSISGTVVVGEDGRTIDCSAIVAQWRVQQELCAALAGVSPRAEIGISLSGGSATLLREEAGAFSLSALAASAQIGPIVLAEPDLSLGPTTLTVSGSGEAMSIDASGTVDGKSWQAAETLRGFGARGIEGRITLAQIPTSDIPGLPADAASLLGKLGLASVAATIDHRVGAAGGSASLALRDPSGTIDADISWDSAALRLTKFAATHRLPAAWLAEVSGVRLGADPELAITAKPLTLAIADLREGKLAARLACEVTTPRLDLLEAPGIADACALTGFRGAAEFPLGGPFSIRTDAGGTLLRGSDEVGSLRAQFAMGGSEMEVGGELAIGERGGVALATLLGQAALADAFEGPGEIDLSWKSVEGKPATIGLRSTLPRVRGSLACTRSAEGFLDAEPSRLDLLVPASLLAQWVAPGATPAREDGVRVWIDLKRLHWSGEAGESAVEASLSIGEWNLARPGHAALRFAPTQATVSSARVDRGLEVSCNGAVRLGTADPMPIVLSVDLGGDLGRIAGAKRELRIDEGTLKATIPGELPEAVTDWLRGAVEEAHAGEDPPLLVSALDLTLTAKGVRFGNQLGEAAGELALDIAPCTVRGARGFSGQVTRAHATASTTQLGRSARCTVEMAVTPVSGKPATLAVDLTGNGIVSQDGAFDPANGAWRGSVEAAQLPTGLLEALADSNASLEELVGQAWDIRVRATDQRGQTRLGASLRSSTVALDAPSLLLSGGVLSITPDAPVTASIVVQSGARQRLLESLNPILSDIRSPRPIRVTIPRATVPLDGNFAGLNGAVRVEVGEVTVVKSNQILSLLSVFQGSSSPEVPARIDPLDVTIAKGIATYHDWNVFVSKLGNEWKIHLALGGKIDLTKTPPYADEITCRYPLDSMARTLAGAFPGQKAIGKISDLLSDTPLALLGAVQLEVLFKGPLGKVDGKDVPLEMEVGPTISGEGAKEAIQKGLEGLGDLFDKLRKK